MSGKIHLTKVDEITPIDTANGTMLERKLADKSTGSSRLEFEHSVITKVVDATDVTYESDEYVYVVEGEAEISFDSETHQLGPTSFFFVPTGAAYDFKVTKAPFVTIAAFSPERE